MKTLNSFLRILILEFIGTVCDEWDPSLVDVLLYVHKKFLADCGLYLLWDQSGSFPIERFLLQLNLPITLLHLSTKAGLDNDRNYAFHPSRNCVGYTVIISNISVLQTVMDSEMFSSDMDPLGRHVFVTPTSENDAPALILFHEVMMWRPNALVLRRIRDLHSEVTGDYEIWSHELFRDNGRISVGILDRWLGARSEKDENLFPNKMNDFQGNTLKAITFEHAPSIVEVQHTSEAGCSDMHRYDGVDIRLMYAMSETLNFQLCIQNPSDGGMWGSPSDNGSWTGAVGDMTQKKGHMAVANFFIHAQILEVLDMTIAYDVDEGCFITPLPAPLPQWMALFFPFSYNLWLITFGSVVLGPISLFLVGRLAVKIFYKDVQWLKSYGATAYYVTSSFVGVGISSVPYLNATRCFFVMWIWFGFLITTYYRSALTAFLTIPLRLSPINTLKQLLSSPLPAWGATGLTFKEILLDGLDPVMHQLAEKYQPVNGAKEGIELTALRKYAMMENRQYLEYTIATNFTNFYGEETLHVMKECLTPFRIGMALPKRAPYKHNFDIVIARIVEAGLVRKWFQDILNANKHQREADHQENLSGSLTVHNLEAAWLVIGFGYLASIVALGVEIIIYRKYHPNRNKA